MCNAAAACTEGSCEAPAVPLLNSIEEIGGVLGGDAFSLNYFLFWRIVIFHKYICVNIQLIYLLPFK